MFKQKEVIERYKVILSIIFDNHSRPIDYIRYTLGFELHTDRLKSINLEDKEEFLESVSRELFLSYLSVYDICKEMGNNNSDIIRHCILLSKHQGHLRGLFNDNIYKKEKIEYTREVLMHNASHMRKEADEVAEEIEKLFDATTGGFDTSALKYELSDILIINLISFSLLCPTFNEVEKVLLEKTLYNVENREIKKTKEE